jgi:hypothetical protein
VARWRESCDARHHTHCELTAALDKSASLPIARAPLMSSGPHASYDARINPTRDQVRDDDNVAPKPPATIDVRLRPECPENVFSPETQTISGFLVCAPKYFKTWLKQLARLRVAMTTANFNFIVD